MDDNLCPEDVNGDTDFLVLDPPPGFEDIPFHLYQDHFYDDPYCGDDELDLTPELDSKTVSHFAEDMACSLLSDVVKPKVRMRLKKSFSTSPTPCCDTFSCTQGDIYSVPIDSLTSNKGREKGLSRQSSRNSGQSCARHSIAATQPDSGEPVHMTLEEVRCYLREFQSSSRNTRPHPWVIVPSKSADSDSKRKSCFVWTPMSVSSKSFDEDRNKRSRKSLSVTAAGIKQALFSVFRIPSHLHHHHQQSASNNQICQTGWTFSMPDRSDVPNSARSSPKQRRALPPIPNEAIGFVRMPRSTPRTSIGTEMQQLDLSSDSPSVNLEPPSPQPPVDLADGKLDSSASASNLDFAASIDQVKNHGWYWGPLSGEAAEKILFSEPDGSFLVRDSSDDHYIFSLSFKLNGGVRHVRIEHDHGNFSFGSLTRFQSQTMVEFIEKAIEHSRSGRFLFFLHRRPTHGPTRVQLLHPVSRFRLVQSLQHLTRFAILRCIRRDQTNLLPLPKRLRDYLNTAHYYSEQPSVSLHSSVA